MGDRQLGHAGIDPVVTVTPIMRELDPEHGRDPDTGDAIADPVTDQGSS